MVKHTQTICRQQRTNCLSVFDHFKGLTLIGLKVCDPRIKGFGCGGNYVFPLPFHVLEPPTWDHQEYIYSHSVLIQKCTYQINDIS